MYMSSWPDRPNNSIRADSGPRAQQVVSELQLILQHWYQRGTKVATIGIRADPDCNNLMVSRLSERATTGKYLPSFVPHAITNMGFALLAKDIGFMGANYSISTACATSNYCFYAAANHIRRGEADVMIAGGTEAPILPIGIGGFVACRALSQRNDDPKTASRLGQR